MFYALKHITKQNDWIGLSVTSQGDAEFCNSVTVDLDIGRETPFITSERSLLEGIISGDYHTPWYNSDLESPEVSTYTRKQIKNRYEIVELHL